MFYNGTNYVGGAAAFVQWMADQYDYEDKTPPAEYQQLADREYDEHLTSLGHQFAFLDFTVGDVWLLQDSTDHLVGYPLGDYLHIQTSSLGMMFWPPSPKTNFFF